MEIKYNIKAKNLTTYGGKGVVKKIYLPDTIEEVAEMWKDRSEMHILGGGSNTIIPDGENDLRVVSFSRLNAIEISEGIFKVGAGVRISRLISTARRYGYGGVEFMAGVPATIGGLVRMNAGAFGHEIGVYVDKIVALNADGEMVEYFAPFDFAYRKGFQGIVLEVCLRLQPMPKDTSIRIEKEYIDKRRKNQPKGRSAGSVFKNTTLSAGYCIDKVGLKGVTKGGAQISAVHGNFIINIDDGSADDFLYLAELAKNRVFEEFGIELQKEFVVLGEI